MVCHLASCLHHFSITLLGGKITQMNKGHGEACFLLPQYLSGHLWIRTKYILSHALSNHYITICTVPNVIDKEKNRYESFM